jgi:hypothetical protein
MIVFERNQWEPGETYYFRSTVGSTPICHVARAKMGWELTFYRGAANPGPYPYASFEAAKRHVMRYLIPRERSLTGPKNAWSAGGAKCDHLAQIGDGPARQTRHPRRARRRSSL